MTEQALDTFLKQEIAAFPCKTAVLVGEVESGKVLWALEPDTQVVSASTIKVPVLLAALEEVRQGRLSLGQTLDLPAEVLLEDSQVFEYGPTSRSLWELLYWMIVESDNTATNRVISTVGYDASTPTPGTCWVSGTRCASGRCWTGTPLPPAGTTTPPPLTSLPSTASCAGGRF